MSPLPPSPLVLADDVLDLVGDTPLVGIRSLGGVGPRAAVWAKMEQANPGGSVKDRICLAMVVDAERSGKLGPGGVVVEPTSGNTGIGLALVCAVRGYRCVLAMPESMSLERRQLLEAFGAEVVLTPEAEQMEGAVAKAREIAAKTPGAFMPQQFDNPANPRVHAETTAREIIEAMNGLSIDAFVAGVGTGGTISGVGEVLRREFAVSADRRGRARLLRDHLARRARPDEDPGARGGVRAAKLPRRSRRRGAHGDRRRRMADQDRSGPA